VAAGQSAVVEFSQPASSLASLDSQDRWTLQPGEYELLLGTSSSQGIAATFTVDDTARVAARDAALH
jgi:hypothetical protein